MSKRDVTLETALAAKETAKRKLADVEGINGIGVSRRGGSYVLKVNFEREPTTTVPERIDGVDVLVEVVGTIHKRASAKGGASRPVR